MSNRTRDESPTGRRRTNCIPRITRSARNYARETGRRTMSHNSAGRLPYDSIVPRASLLDDRATRPPLRTGWPLASSTLRPRDRPRGRCLHVSAPLERNSFSSCKRLCITGRGITGYTRAWVVSRGAFFLLFHAQRACVCGVYVVVGTRGCRAHLILQCAHVLHLSFFLWMDIFPLASLDRREGRCGERMWGAKCALNLVAERTKMGLFD